VPLTVANASICGDKAPLVSWNGERFAGILSSAAQLLETHSGLTPRIIPARFIATFGSDFASSSDHPRSIICNSASYIRQAEDDFTLRV